MTTTNEDAGAALKPCPFCCRDDLFTQSALGRRQVVCETCEASGPTEETDEEAIEAWNRLGLSRSVDSNRRAPSKVQVEAVRATTDVDEAQEPVAWTSAERLETLKRDGSRARTMWGADLAGPCDVPLYAASIRRDFATIPSKETIARLFIKHGGPVPDEGWCLNESGLNDFLGELFPDAAAASGGEKV